MHTWKKIGKKQRLAAKNDVKMPKPTPKSKEKYISIKEALFVNLEDCHFNLV